MLTEEQRGRIETLLLRERGEALEAIEHFDERMTDLRDRAGEMSLYRLHPADVGSESQEQEQDFLLASIEGRRLYQVDEALDRLYHTPEAFGICQACGQPIEFERLELLPQTRVCAADALRADAENGTADDANPREAGPPAD